jgi:hypothetical protein
LLNRFYPCDFRDFIFEKPLDPVMQRYRRARTAVTRALQPKLYDTVDKIDQFDIAAVRLERRSDLIYSIFYFFAKLVHVLPPNSMLFIP